MIMKKIIALFMALVLCLVICGCNDSVNDNSESKKKYNYSNNYNNFSNKYGSKSTKCAKSGCNNYIASSGDSAYCTTHSKKCLECHCYIDEDALYCMSCLKKAANDIKKDNTYNKNNYSHECYVCGKTAYSKYGSYYYCSSCLELVKAFS